MVTARLISVRMRLLKTWPASTAGRQIRIVLKRAMRPSVMSLATEMAVICAAPATVNRSIPGVRKSM
jgi:hypothetical protein